MTTDEVKPGKELLLISKEPGVVDLPLKVRSKFAQAIREERHAGHTTPQAERYLQEAIDAENAS